MTSTADRPPHSGDERKRQRQAWSLRSAEGGWPYFASSALVAVPDGKLPLGEIAIGDQVLTAIRHGAEWEWSAREVQFSAGSPPNTTGVGNVMFYIEYGGQQPGERRQAMVASPNQLFLLADGGILKRADQLVPGTDRLVDPDGRAVPIARIHSGSYFGAVHHIATEVPDYGEFRGSLERHFIIVNGVVCGDFALQRYQHAESMQRHLAPGTDNPAVGTAIYRARHAAVCRSAFGAAVDLDAGPVVHPEFVPDIESATVIPPRAATLFTPRQEAQLLDPDVPARPMSDATNRWMAAYYSRLYATFCPGIRFHVDWTSQRPNVFAFTEYGQKTVVIGGGLLRLEALYDGATAVALAFGAACLADQASERSAGRPADKPPGTGRALYEGIAVVAGSALQGGNAWRETMQAGKRQLGELIAALIRKQHRPADVEALECLLEAMRAAVEGDELPRCVGGPTPGGLQVVSASYDGAGGQLNISFSEALHPHSAGNAHNYRIHPAAPVRAVQFHPRRPAAVALVVDLAPGEYTVEVLNVRAADGSTLDPLAASAPVSAG